MEEARPLKVGDRAPDFKMDVYLPGKKDFGTVELSGIPGKFRAFKFVSENPAQVCPARWEKTLTPGKDLVGRVGEELGG